jgi:hypothetical protein
MRVVQKALRERAVPVILDLQLPAACRAEQEKGVDHHYTEEAIAWAMAQAQMLST